MKNIPHFMKRELTRLSRKYDSLQGVYRADVEWLENGTLYLSGENLKLANWFNENTLLFESEFIRRKQEDSQ